MHVNRQFAKSRKVLSLVRIRKAAGAVEVGTRRQGSVAGGVHSAGSGVCEVF